MKKFLTLAAAAGLAVSASAELQTLKLVGKQISTADGEAIQLKGFSTFSIHFGHGTACLEPYHFEAMKNFGANVVRLAVYVDDPNDGGAYLSNPSKYDGLVKSYIQTAIDNDMYVVVDWHILDTGQNSRQPAGDPNTYTADAQKFFKTISSFVASNPALKGRVLYELCNEPSLGVNFSRIKEYAEPTMDVILANDPDALCIIGTEAWCQKILDAAKNPCAAKYKDHALYSFHYYACDHYGLLGDLKNATAMVPCIVSEWSTVNFTGNGDHCGDKADQLMAMCGTSDDNGRLKVAGQNNGKQLISWFFWNWGQKNEGSTVFAGSCSDPANSNKRPAGEYILKILGGGSVKPLPEPEGYPNCNIIPSTATKFFDWQAYDYGGEGIAYHDGNGAAYVKDAKGYYMDYATGKDEADAMSEGRNYTKGDPSTSTAKLGMNPNFGYGNGILPTSVKGNDGICVAFDWSTETCAEQGFKSLNAGLGYCLDLSFFSDDKLSIDGADPVSVDHGRAYGGVDVSKCSGMLQGAGTVDVEPDQYKYGNICQIEPGEWITYTVDVKKAGYYKVHYLASGQNVDASIGFSLNDAEIGGNIVRDFDAKDDVMAIGSLYTAPGEGLAATDYNHWRIQQLYDMENLNENVGVVFRKAGKQSITITFNEENGNTGPLYFELVDEDVTPEIKAQEALAYSESSIAVYPNPTSGEFTVALGTSEAAEVSVINMAGQVVYSTSVEGVENVTIAKKLAAGVYNVVVSSEFGVKSTKLQVK